jgi:hypothetical protein
MLMVASSQESFFTDVETGRKSGRSLGAELWKDFGRAVGSASGYHLVEVVFR